MKPSLPVIRNLGGCGSTLLCRIISALPNIVLLSECNPRSAYLYGGYMNPIAQLRSWFPDILHCLSDFDDFELGCPTRFGEMINTLQGELLRRNLQLVIRDYNYVDFIGTPFVCPASNNLSLDLAVRDHFDIKDIILVRHPADQLASLRSHRALRNLDAGHFIDSYVRFLSALPCTKIVQYEELVSNASWYMPRICSILGLTWNEEALSKFAHVANITGNMERVSEDKLVKHQRKETAILAEEQLHKYEKYSMLLKMLCY